MSEVGSVETKELTLDLEKAVESAESKVTDLIWGDRFYSHGFVRTGPHNDKGLHTIAPDPSEIDTSVDRLVGILDKGVLSRDFAKRIGVATSRNWADPVNDKNVSVIDNYQAGFMDTFDLVQGWGDNQPDNLFVVLISGDLATHGKDPLTPFNESKYRKLRVAPKHLRGIVVNSEDIDNPIADKVAEEMLKVYTGREELALPIYTRRADLCWPAKVPHHEVKNFVKARQQKALKK